MATIDALKIALTRARDELWRQGEEAREAGDEAAAGPVYRAGNLIDTLTQMGAGLAVLDDHVLARKTPRRRKAVKP